MRNQNFSDVTDRPPSFGFLHYDITSHLLLYFLHLSRDLILLIRSQGGKKKAIRNPSESIHLLAGSSRKLFLLISLIHPPAPCPAQSIGKTVILHHRPLVLTQRREQDKEATVYIGNLDERVSDSLVWELMLQAGRIVNVHLPKDRVTQLHQGYGFVEFISEEDAEYAAKIMNGIRLYGKPIRVNKASADKQKTVEIGAELFIGNLDPMVTEQVLYDTFNRFGNLVNLPKVRSPVTRKCNLLIEPPFYHRLPVTTTISLGDMDLFLSLISNHRTQPLQI